MSHPGRNPGSRGSKVCRRTLSTGKPYTRGNSLYLMSRGIRQGHSDNRWGTYKQIEALGGQVRKGERGTKVLYYTDHARIAAKDEGGKPLKDKDGKTVYEEYQRNHPVVRQYTVFNADQTEGLKLRSAKHKPRRSGRRTRKRRLRFERAASRSTTFPEIKPATAWRRIESRCQNADSLLRPPATTRRRFTNWGMPADMKAAWIANRCKKELRLASAAKPTPAKNCGRRSAP